MKGHCRTITHLAATVLLLHLGWAGAALAKEGADEPKTDDQKIMYFLGVAVSRSLADFALTDAEIDMMTKGLRESLKGNAMQLDPAVYGPKLQELAHARKQIAVEKEQASSQAFLDAEAKKKGAKKTESGLIYFEEEPGTGPQPSPTDTVRVHYHGTLRDGTVFDSSIERGKPAEFPLNRVIPCWTEGVAMMKVGGKAKLVCPAKIAYGDRGNPPTIPGGAALVFEVQLLDIVKK